MHIIGSLWWVWLIIAFAFFVIGFWNMSRKMKRLMTERGREEEIVPGIMFSIYFWFLLGGLSAIFFLIGIVVRIIEFAR